MSWIVIPYFLNLAPLDTLHPLFFRACEFKPSPSASWSLFYSSRLVVRAVDRSDSCLIPVIRE
ncbi:hypothetical protein FIV39_29505 [Pseudomonas grimontii]|uniref:Uncharacterized protein n=1 Tax=Pseudomonas grimontii TaxID=129847 RepID=A0A5C5NUH7_9PSED|nr:hypothetical protein FIV39_29505 [Pseudomonas grimontii]